VLKVYGLKTCDTCRKAVKWLEREGIAHKIIDVRADGVSKAEIARFARAVGWEKLLNKASTTWRMLDDEDKKGLSESKAVSLMNKHPTLIKRPVFDAGKSVIVGFRDAEMKALKALK